MISWAAALLVLAGVLVALDRLAVAMMRPPRRPVVRSPRDHGLSFRDWTVPGDPELDAWWVTGEASQGPVVILAHGWGANRSLLLPLARFVAPEASAVVAFDVRGHGSNDRDPRVSIRDFRDDTLRTVRAVAEEAPGRPIVVVGHSMGGAAAVLASAKGAPPDGVAVVATPFDVYAAIARYLDERSIPGDLLVPILRPFWRRHVGMPLRHLHPGRAVEGLRDRPLLVIQPAEDKRVVPEEGRALARAGAGELVMVPGADHRGVLSDPVAGNALRTFLSGFAEAPGERRQGTAPVQS